jgi:CRP/FNR family cyclic AMP-dependent transcriptional regulator
MAVAGKHVDPGIAQAALRSCPLFGGMGDVALEAVVRLLRTRRFRRNEVIFHAGDPGDTLFIVESGSAKVILASAEGQEAIIATLHRGDYFGEIAMLDDEPRSATVVALEPTDLFALARVPFLELVETDRSVRHALLTGLAAELRRITRHAEELYFLDLPGRLAMRLVELAREADPAGPGAELPWHYTQSDLASMIGGSRQSVNRVLSALSEEDLLRIERDAIVIPDVEALARVAER